MLTLRKYIPGRQISLHFTEDEFRCKCCGMIIVNPILIRQLEALRHALGDKPINVSSGYRCLNHNRAVGGSPRSQHLYGNAADIYVSGISPKELAKQAGEFFDGIGIYEDFVHVDVRGYPARW
jgi:uncharacterized protein YcbK (DUF882 family)